MSAADSHKSYRPLTTFTYRLNVLVSGLDPFGFHLVDLVLHAVTCVVFHAAAELVTHDSMVSFGAALLFATHPIHTEAVANTTGRADVLCALFFMLGLLSYARSAAQPKYIGASMACLALAAFSKEHGLTLFGITTAYDILTHTSLLAAIFRSGTRLWIASYCFMLHDWCKTCIRTPIDSTIRSLRHRRQPHGLRSKH